MAYVSVATAAKTIRANLKAASIRARAMSVRSESYSMGSSINVKIVDPSVSFKAVKAACADQEEIRRDHTGDILSGGNRYVFVEYADEAVQAALATATKNGALGVTFRGHDIVPIADSRFGEVYVDALRGRPAPCIRGAVRALLCLS